MRKVSRVMWFLSPLRLSKRFNRWHLNHPVKAVILWFAFQMAAQTLTILGASKKAVDPRRQAQVRRAMRSPSVIGTTGIKGKTLVMESDPQTLTVALREMHDEWEQAKDDSTFFGDETDPEPW